jgi:hypothetical protein
MPDIIINIHIAPLPLLMSALSEAVSLLNSLISFTKKSIFTSVADF